MRISAWSSDVCSSDLRLVEAGIVDADGGLGGDAGQQALMPFEEAAGLRMSEEKAADHLPGPAEDGNRQIAFHGQMPFRHTLAQLVLSVARVTGDVVGTNDPFAAERRPEHRRVARHRKFVEVRAPGAWGRVRS